MAAKIAEIPVIETVRVRLRAHAWDDLDDYAAMWVDPVVTRFITGRAQTREESWARMLQRVGTWPMMGYGFWIAEDLANGRIIGEAGFIESRRDFQPVYEGTPEVGWALAPSEHGKGLATEIVSAALAWGEANIRSERTVCIIDIGNTASRRVAEKLGYREIARHDYKGATTILHERWKP